MPSDPSRNLGAFGHLGLLTQTINPKENHERVKLYTLCLRLMTPPKSIPC